MTNVRIKRLNLSPGAADQTVNHRSDAGHHQREKPEHQKDRTVERLTGIAIGSPHAHGTSLCSLGYLNQRNASHYAKNLCEDTEFHGMILPDFFTNEIP